MSTVDLLKRAELAVRGCVEELLAPFGLTPTQFLVLFRLKHSTRNVSSAELARAAGIRPQSVVDLIGPLERRGLIHRREAPEHRRILRISLSAEGEELFARALPAASKLERKLLANLTAGELSGLRAGLQKLLINAEAHESPHPAMKRTAAPAARPRSEIRRGLRKTPATARTRRRAMAQ